MELRKENRTEGRSGTVSKEKSNVDNSRADDPLPHCVLGDQFRSLLLRPAWSICEQCGHVAIPEDPGFRVPCRNCLELNRAA